MGKPWWYRSFICIEAGYASIGEPFIAYYGGLSGKNPPAADLQVTSITNNEAV